MEKYRKGLDELKDELRDYAALSFATTPEERLAALEKELATNEALLKTRREAVATIKGQSSEERELSQAIAQRTEALQRQVEAGWTKAADASRAAIADLESELSALQSAREAANNAVAQTRSDNIKAVEAVIKAINDEINVTKELVQEQAKGKAASADTLRRIEAQQEIIAGFKRIQEESKLAAESGEEYNEAEERRAVVLEAIQGLLDDNFTVEGAGIQRILAQYGDVFANYDKQIQALKDLEQQKKDSEKAADDAIQAEQRRTESSLTYGVMEIEAERSASAEKWALAWKLYDEKKALRDKEAAEIAAVAKKEREDRQRTYDIWAGTIRDIGNTVDVFTEAYLESLAEQGKSDKEIDKERRRIARNKAIADKTFALINITINTAVAVMKALAELGPIWGTVAGFGISAAGIAQGLAVAAQPIPALAKGGKIRPVVGGVARVAEAGIGEFQVPDRTDAFEELASKIAYQMSKVHIDNQVSMPEQMMHVTVNLGDRTLYDDIAKATRDGRLLIDARAVV